MTTHSSDDTPLIQQHGGYRNLKSFQLAETIYDITVRFCSNYIDQKSRTRDQMVQAARSGRQNIAEGSMDSATSKKIEIKLTGIAKGSLEELRLDYEDFLRQRGLPQWNPDHPALLRLKSRRCNSLQDFRLWIGDELKRANHTDNHGLTRTQARSTVPVRESPCPSVFAANGALTLLNLGIYLLDRQMQAQATAFEQEGGFSERLYRHRSSARAQQRQQDK